METQIKKPTNYITSQIKSVDNTTGSFEVIASTADIDRDGESIDPKGWDLKNYLKNPVILWAHNYSDLPIGVAEKIENTDNGLKIVGKFASAEANPKAEQVRRLYAEGIQRAVSVGFIPTERDEKDASIITKAELLELSFVPVPANPNALALAYKKGLNAEFLFEKTTVEPHNPSRADRERDWDVDVAIRSLREWAGGDDRDEIDFNKYAQGFAWFDDDEPDNFGSYKLPHHEVIDGELQTVWRGVVSAMAVLLGARGGVDVPESDKQGIWDHLSEHYDQFGESAPALRAYTETELKELFPETKSPACRMDDETIDECMQRKIPEIIGEGREQEQAIAIARSVCEAACNDKSKKQKPKKNIKRMKFEKIDIEKLVPDLTKRVSELLNDEPRPGKSGKKVGKQTGLSGTIVELPVEVLDELRQATLKAYQLNELVLTFTKAVKKELNKNNE